MSNEKHAILKIVLTFVISAAAGCMIGILFAPAGGKKTRHNIQKKINKAGEIAKDNYKKIAKVAENGIEAQSKNLKKQPR
jgi:gas vesicle protein